MKRRLAGMLVASGTALLLAPAAASADEVDTTCKNGNDPVHYSLTDASPIIKVQARVLCIRKSDG